MVVTGLKKCFCIILTVVQLSLMAQHDHHAMEMDSTASGKEMSPMTHAFSLNLPMTRNGSGTGWLPDSTPMYGYMLHRKKWMYMFHGNIFSRYTKQDVFNNGSRGGEKFDVVNWFMVMGQRRVGNNGLFRFSCMLSLDNLFGGNGYPLLFQTGETWQGMPLVDRQHPHDLFSELSVAYTHAINKKTDIFIYAAYPGEPALGSVAFMHRVSSLYTADAPLSHHWNDGTHITFGVLTGGLRLDKFKLEGSVFNGREPDENRYSFDSPRFNSYSGRVSFNPNPSWSLQLSEGFVKSPEYLNADENVCRTTASAVYSKPLRKSNFFNATALWALNKSDANEHAALLEAVVVLNKLALYTRLEYVQKSAQELNLDLNGYDRADIFPVKALTLGVSYDVIRSKNGSLSLGAQGTYYSVDGRLNSLYGKDPTSAQVFLRLYPPRMRMMRKPV